MHRVGNEGELVPDVVILDSCSEITHRVLFRHLVRETKLKTNEWGGKQEASDLQGEVEGR